METSPRSLSSNNSLTSSDTGRLTNKSNNNNNKSNNNNTSNIPKTAAATNRKEISKAIPKLTGEQTKLIEAKLSKLDNANDINKLGSPSKNAILLPNQANTKIPMKRTPAKSNLTPRSLKNSQAISVSKISLSVKEVAGRKVNREISKISLRTSPSTNTKQASPQQQLQKALTARPGISKRSASTISCKSTPTEKMEDTPNIPPLPKITSTAGDQECHSLSARERVTENNKLRVFETLHKKLQIMQTEFMQKFETLKNTSPDKLKCSYKFITLIRNDDCKLVVKDEELQRLPKKIPAHSVYDLKERIKFAMDNSLSAVMEYVKSTQDSNADYENSLKLEEIYSQLQKEQGLRMLELYAFLREIGAMRDGDGDTQIVKMQREIQEGKKSLQAAERKMLDLKSDYEGQLMEMEGMLKDKTDVELTKRDTQIAELHKKLKVLEKHCEKLKSSVQQSVDENSHDHVEKKRLEDDLKAYKDNLSTVHKKLVCTEKQLNEEKKDKQERVENFQKLEAELEASKKKYDELKALNKTDTTHKQQEERKEITKLKKELEALEVNKSHLETQIEDMKQQCTAVTELQNQLHDSENRIKELESVADKGDQDCRPENVKEMQNEIAKLRQSENEKRREIDKLKVEISKAHFNLCQLEEQIQRDQQLLEVRSELINSLQTNDNSQRIHLDEMFAQVGEKNNTINELNNELRTKSEEFRNLFTTLSTKQMELSRQEHMIKLLEESNERSQMLRVKQEEKIGRMDEEIAHLKQTIAIYQNNVIGSAACKNLLFAPVTPTEEYNENFYYYTSERKRKRQVDINVKKYET